MLWNDFSWTSLRKGFFLYEREYEVSRFAVVRLVGRCDCRRQGRQRECDFDEDVSQHVRSAYIQHGI